MWGWYVEWIIMMLQQFNHLPISRMILCCVYMLLLFVNLLNIFYDYFHRSVGYASSTTRPWMPSVSSANMSTSSRTRSAVQSWHLSTQLGCQNSKFLSNFWFRRRANYMMTCYYHHHQHPIKSSLSLSSSNSTSVCLKDNLESESLAITFGQVLLDYFTTLKPMDSFGMWWKSNEIIFLHWIIIL